MDWQLAVYGFIGTYAAVVIYFAFRRIPFGVDYSGPERRVQDSKIRFLFDLTWREQEQRRAEQHIFNNILSLIANARRLVVLDMFLFNTHLNDSGEFLPVTRQLVDALIDLKKRRPAVKIYFITDPINNFYGSYSSGPLNAMRDAGVDVILTNTNSLRDRNFLYSGLWRLFFQWFDTSGKGWLPDPMRSRRHRVTFRAILKAMNARANHRKLVVCDSGDTYVSLVTSSNIHEASSWLSNIGFAVEGLGIAHDCLNAERAVARLSNADIPTQIDEGKNEGAVRVRLLSERPIKRCLLDDIDRCSKGDAIRIAMLFLGDRAIMRALLRASARGVEICLILDRNRQSFGREKEGFPNRVTGLQLQRRSRGRIRVLWWRNRRDDLHSKLMWIRTKKTSVIYGGSANFTQRNIRGYTLELMLRVEAGNDCLIVRQVCDYFDRISGGVYSEIADPNDPGHIKRLILYYLQQLTGITTY